MMISLSFIRFFILFGAATIAINIPPGLELQRLTASTEQLAAAAAAPKTLPLAESTAPLVAKVPRSNAMPATRHGTTAVIHGTDFDQVYLTNVTIGSQHFLMIVDTGSSDTWVVQNNFRCLDLNGTSEPQSTCKFGMNLFNPSSSPTFVLEPDVNLNITYGSGEFVAGPVGFETVSIGGVTVINQTIPTPNVAAFLGDTFSSGVLGLANPALTSVYPGTDPTKDDRGISNNVRYDPFFYTAVKQGAVKSPFFSVALNRGTPSNEANSPFDTNLGFLAFGGIAPVPVTRNSITVPVQGCTPQITPGTGPNVTYLWYTVDVQSYIFPGSASVETANNNTIVDTGSTFNVVPDAVATAYNASFDPPAVFDPNNGIYIVACNATVPPFTVVVGGKRFAIDRKDLLRPSRNDNGEEICVSGIVPGGPDSNPRNLFILGDTFLHNVVATFNIESLQITFTERQPY